MHSYEIEGFGIMNEYSTAVIMATYNGADYIVEQLNSILHQTIPPSEVIIQDDGSSDETVGIAEDFISFNHCANWTVRKNEENLGFVKNFLTAGLHSKADVIFYSDQDDVWLPNKISSALEVFKRQEDAMVVACETKSIDSSEISSRIASECLRKERRVPLREQITTMASSGLTLAIKRDFFERMAPIILKHNLTHDVPMGLFASAKGGFYRCGSVQVLHRLHEFNVSSPSRSVFDRINHKQRHIQGRELQLQCLIALNEEAGEFSDGVSKTELESEINARKESIEFLKNNCCSKLFKAMFRKSKLKNQKIEIANYVICLVGRN